MRHLFFAFALALSLPLAAQIYSPVKWTFTLTPAADGDYVFLAKASIEKGWWVYSQHLENDEGPIATTLNFDPGDHYKLTGKNKESANIKQIYDKVFEMQVSKFADYYSIEQKIKVSDLSKPVTGYLNFMTCNDERCLPPTDAEFSLMAPPAGGKPGNASPAPPGKAPASNPKTGATPEKKKNEALSQGEGAGTSSPSGKPSIPSGPGVLQPVKWTFTSEKKSEGIYTIVARARIDDGWHIYGPGESSEDGPIPTSLSIAEDAAYAKAGDVSVESSGRVTGHDQYFDMEVVKFKHDARLAIDVRAAAPSVVSGAVEFTACDATKCLAPEYVEFHIDLATGQPQAGEAASRNGPSIDESGLVDHTIPTIRTTFEHPVSDCGEHATTRSSGLLWMFLFGIINGLLALLTPCVFPMIPLTVSFFTKDTKRKGWQNGLWYGASIILIYVILGLLVTILFGAGSLNELSTNPAANTIFFIIFIVFAFSFFGFYEITLPSSWSNKSDAMADKGGLVGIFFMAATLAIVSFSCTGPLIGTALVEASSKGFLGPLVVMSGFSFALAVPFGLFAAFPAWLNSLPKSGGWMNSVKVLLGFAELALALKFLSVADMTAHWGFLRYEVFIGLWVLIAAGMAAYLFGWIRFPHDSPDRRITPPVGLLGLAFAALAVYLASGLMPSPRTGTYNALSLMSGLAPPAHYNFFKPTPEVASTLKNAYASVSKCANNLDCFHDFYEGLAFAKQANRPILLDFTGYGCVNCRKTEEHIWVRDEIRNKISNDFVLISLYVDDKEELDQQLRSAVTSQRIRTVGQKWTDFQISNFNQNSQPLYVIMSPDQQVLTTPRGYDPDVQGYNAFLECGLSTFRAMAPPAVGDAR